VEGREGKREREREMKGGKKMKRKKGENYLKYKIKYYKK